VVAKSIGCLRRL